MQRFLWRTAGGAAVVLTVLYLLDGADEQQLHAVGQVFLAPALFVIFHIPWLASVFDDYGPFIWLFLSWWCWLTAARLTWCVTGRIFGFYNPAHYSFWTALWVPWRPLYRIWLPLAWWWEERRAFSKTASARVARPVEAMALLYRPGDIYLGRFRPFGLPAFQPIGISGSGGRHLFMVAGTGGGKTTHLITMLGLHKGTAFIIDPKAQIASVMATRMGDGGCGIIAKGRKVRILAPTGMIENHASASWNMFDEIHRAGDRAESMGRRREDAIVEFAQRATDGLIVRYGKENPFWPGASKEFLLGLMLYMISTEPRERQTLTRLYELVTVGLPKKVRGKETGFDVLLFEMSENRAFGGVIAASAASLTSGGPETVGSVLMTMREQLKWLKRPELRRCTETSDFHLEELKTGNLVLFVCAKLTDIREGFPGWFRLLTVMAMAVFEDIKGGLKDPCLFALDEFASLGKIDAIETAAPYMRSFGVRLLCIIQNLGQLNKGLYDNWETFIGNAECCWWMATQHVDNLKYLESMMGRRTIKTKLDGPSRWLFLSKRMRRYDYKEREVMTAEQIRRYLARGNMIVTRAQRPLMLKPEPYFKALPVVFYERDRDYRETISRSVSRLLARIVLRGKTIKRTTDRLPASVDFQTALTIFGFSADYRAPELEARYEAMLAGDAAARSTEYARVIELAYDVLVDVLIDRFEREAAQ